MSRSLRLAVSAVAVLGLLALSSAVFAQPPGGRGGFGPMGGGGMMGPGGGANMSLMLLRNEKVQKELDLVDDQKTKIKELGDKAQAEMREAFSGLRDLSQEERRAKMEEMRKKSEARAKETAKKLDEILLPQQKERLDQIELQIQGVGALRNAEVQKTLGITEEQKAKFKTIGEESQKQMRELFEKRDEMEQGQMREKMQAMQKEVGEKTLGVLTQEQKEKFEKMKGPKFDIDFASLFGGRRGPQPKPAAQ